MALFGGSKLNYVDPMGFAPPPVLPSALMPAPTLALPKQKRGLFGGGDPENPMTGAQRMQMLGATLRDVGAGLNGQGGEAVSSLQQAMQAQQAKAKALKAAEANRAQLAAMAEQLNMDPREKVLFFANPNEWAKANASRFEAYTLAPGAKRGVGGQQVDYAPQNIEMGDQLVQTQADGGAQSVFTRAPTFAESTTQKKVEAEIKNLADRLGIDQAQLVEMIRAHKATEAVAQGNLGMRGKEFEARRAAGGFGTPGVGGVLGATLDPNDWEIQ